MSCFKLGSKQSKVRSDETITDQKLDGKDQPIDQYKLTSKKAGKNTKEIKQGWHDSITTAHKMLVEVNQELSKILKELEDISNKLDKLNQKSELDGTLLKFNYVLDKMDAASGDANHIAKDFRKLIPKHISQAAEQISKITKEDFNKLEKKIGKKEVQKLKDAFRRIKLLQQNVNTNAQDANQAAERSKKKKPELVTDSRSSAYKSEEYESEEYDSEEYDSSSEEEVTTNKKNLTEKKNSSEEKSSESSSTDRDESSSSSSDSTSSDS
jgi:hypothetical protein